ncbi:DNA repair protein RecN [Pelosinus propionicus]|uniref:DNA repair protein RecN n=1 Tax=Pelosinus propionicus DSM 13327 TaxID=1123291 RepID=A0A1I4KQW0_9FIRM|nr:DNA repair protein RecN [Pelosinus propionicus]SFL81120.1 DNA repair protein RecN (Recombination protein N) [Pelosinus propionicus DSM 13327]
MLKSLTVTNFALIEQAVVEFDEGLNILTGETGAGKSILIDALSIILGNRASVDSIRTGCDFFRVEAVFDISKLTSIYKIIDEQGITLEDDAVVIVSRRFSRQGKNSILINGCHVTVNTLRQIGEKLVDMHGQHENQALLRPESYLALLDAFDKNIKIELEQYRQLHQKWVEVIKQQEVLAQNSRERAQRIDMLSWQTKEIALAQLKPGEEEEIEQQIPVLSNVEKITTAVNRSYILLEQGTDGIQGIIPALAEVKHELEMIARYDNRIQEQLASISDALYQLEESCTDLRLYGDEIDFDPHKLATLQERMDVIYKLKKKYGTTITEILQYYEKSLAELEDIHNYDQTIAKFSQQQKTLEEKLNFHCERLHTLRMQSSKRLSEQIGKHLTDLGMANATFDIAVISRPDFTIHGTDEVSFLFSANLGEQTKPLYKIASGGELSRIALAIKTVCAYRDAVGIMVFDEIDAGIGGQAGHMIAEKVANVACARQVLCITHLPQIACMADRHVYIKKQIEGERTNTIVTVLTKEEQLLELTRMISGNEITPIALENANQIFKSALIKKEKWKNKAQA